MHGSRLLLAVCTALVATQTVCPGRAQDHTAKPEDTDSKNPEEGMETANPETVVEDGRTEPPGATNSAESQVLESNADKGSVKEVNVSTSTPETSITLYTLSREGEPCILMQMDASITFVYRTKSGEDREVSEYVPAEVETDGDCKEEDEANFALQWPNHVLTWNFAKTPGRERWYVNGVRLDVRTDSSKKFQYINKPGLRTLKSSKGHTMLFPTPVGKSYSCQSETSVELQNGDVSATVFLRGFKLQPFISRRDFGPVYECSPGGGPAFRDETAPIAVGSTLAVVVLLTVTGYGVYRYFKVKKVQYDTME